MDWQASPHGGIWIPELDSSANYYLEVTEEVASALWSSVGLL